MKINISKIEPEIINLQNLINSYIDNYTKIYSTLSNTNYYWTDINSKKFYNYLLEEKESISANIKELNSMYKVFEYIVSEYKKIGKKISIDLSNNDKINAKLNKYIEKLTSIISIYNSMNLQYYNDLRVYSQKQKFINMKEMMINTKNKINGYFDKINKIENQINTKLSSINIKKIPEIKMEQYL